MTEPRDDPVGEGGDGTDDTLPVEVDVPDTDKGIEEDEA